MPLGAGSLASPIILSPAFFIDPPRVVWIEAIVNHPAHRRAVPIVGRFRHFVSVLAVRLQVTGACAPSGIIPSKLVLVVSDPARVIVGNCLTAEGCWDIVDFFEACGAIFTLTLVINICL